MVSSSVLPMPKNEDLSTKTDSRIVAAVDVSALCRESATRPDSLDWLEKDQQCWGSLVACFRPCITHPGGGKTSLSESWKLNGRRPIT